MNIKFNYLYRDSGNYKQHSHVIFSNPLNRNVSDILKIVIAHLKVDNLFPAEEWGVPDLHFEDWDDELDYAMHEFENIEETTLKPTIYFNLERFLALIKMSGRCK